jgi:alkanesulfonate monooxygenase SsuD/methylene tetrahydromethanopterin reductase-like flavin-dependent oxidoreductase (luciferase family)
VRLGLNLGYWGAGNDTANLALAQEAERLGYSVVWAAEAYGSDAPTVLAWVAAQTERIDIGSAILQIPARSPAMTAMTAATLDTLSGGRFRLGLGVSGPQVSEGWHGVRLSRPGALYTGFAFRCAVTSASCAAVGATSGGEGSESKCVAPVLA